MRRVLRLPVYRRLLAAYSLNELAWSVGALALAVLIYRRTGSALGSTAFFLVSLVIPALSLAFAGLVQGAAISAAFPNLPGPPLRRRQACTQARAAEGNALAPMMVADSWL